MIQPDHADILLAIHHLCHTLLATGTIVVCHHIYRHQDTCTLKTPSIFDASPTPLETHSRSNHSGCSDQGCMLVHTSAPSRPRTHDTLTLINTACNELAMETSSAALHGASNENLPPTISYPLPGSRAQIRIGDTWITSHQWRHILWE